MKPPDGVGPPGATLAAWQAQCRPGPEAVIRAAIRVARAVDEAHEKGTPHGGLVAAGVRFTEVGGVELPGPVPAGPAAGASPGGTPCPQDHILEFGRLVEELLGRTGRRRRRLAGEIETIVASCAEPDPERRCRDLADAALLLEAGLQRRMEARGRQRRRLRLSWGLAGGVLLAVAGFMTAVAAGGRPGPVARALGLAPASGTPLAAAPVVRYRIFPRSPAGRPALTLDLTSDGRLLSGTVIGQEWQSRLWVRDLQGGDDLAVAGQLLGVRSPFLAPDGSEVILKNEYGGERLLRVFLDGRPAEPFVEGTDRGVAWDDEGGVIVVPTVRSGLLRVPPDGGHPQWLTEPVTERGEITHRWPDAVRGHGALLFTIGYEGLGSFDEASIAVLDQRSGEVKILVRGGSHARYLPPGYLIYCRSAGLMAVPFDPDRLEIKGAPRRVLEGLASVPNTGHATFAVSDSGTLVYQPGGEMVRRNRLVWADRDGTMSPVISDIRPFGVTKVSPDGGWLATTLTLYHDDLWLVDLSRELLSRFTYGRTNGANPHWSPDGRHIVFTSVVRGQRDIFWAPADGSGMAEALVASDDTEMATGVSRDGRWVAYTRTDPETGADVWVAGIPHGTAQRPLIRTPAKETDAVFSPDGRWVAYVSDTSGRQEVWVCTFEQPAATARRISEHGGIRPQWSPDGSEIYFAAGSDLMVVPFGPDGVPEGAAPEVLFTAHTSGGFGFDVSSDGERFLIVQVNEPELSDHVVVVHNWVRELQEMMPLESHL